MERTIKLSNRLKTIAGFIRQGAAIADIGTDHGFLAVYLAQTGLARRIIASDISSGSLKSARRSAEKYGVSDKITFIVADGLKGVCETDVDTIVIAGVGGETIEGILKDVEWTKNGKWLILQPQSKIDVLCRFLYESGYIIHKTEFAQDKGRTYTVMLAKMDYA